MDSPRGRILELLNDGASPRAVVLIDAAAECPRCAAGKGCGAGIFGGGDARRVEALVADGLRVRAGDAVRIDLAPRNLLRAAGEVYGAPLVCGVGAAGLAYLLGAGDGPGAVAALVGLAVGLALGRWRLRRAQCLQRFTPVVTARLVGA